MTSEKNQEPKLSLLYTVLLDIEPKLRGVAYNFTSEENFRKIDSIEEMQLVYWCEIVQRLHVCASTSIKRLKKWYDAAISAYDVCNYYGFCASLRGLIEACADTFYTISKVSEPICTNFATVEIALMGHAKKILLSESIEDELIHYTHARKLTKSEKRIAPKSHDAKKVRTYIDSIIDKGILNLYSELCQVSHPSSISLSPFLFSTEEYSLILHEQHIDKHLNDDLMKRHKPAILSASNLSIIPAMCLLKLINEFNTPITEALRTDEQILEPAVRSDLWKNMSNKIRISRSSQQNAK